MPSKLLGRILNTINTLHINAQHTGQKQQLHEQITKQHNTAVDTDLLHDGDEEEEGDGHEGDHDQQILGDGPALAGQASGNPDLDVQMARSGGDTPIKKKYFIVEIGLIQYKHNAYT